MKIPSTPEQLATAIETLVASYMGEVRLASKLSSGRWAGRRYRSAARRKRVGLGKRR